jgi:hypothetical protein
MKVIAIDTSSGFVDAVAVADGETIAKATQKEKGYPFRVEEHIAGAVKKLVKAQNGLPELVVINLGPGSYTSLRSGISFVKGWYLGLKTKGGGKEPFKIVGVKRTELSRLPTRSSLVNIIAREGIKRYTEGIRQTLKELNPVYSQNSENVDKWK